MWHSAVTLVALTVIVPETPSISAPRAVVLVLSLANTFVIGRDKTHFTVGGLSRFKALSLTSRCGVTEQTMICWDQ